MRDWTARLGHLLAHSAPDASGVELAHGLLVELTDAIGRAWRRAGPEKASLWRTLQLKLLVSEPLDLQALDIALSRADLSDNEETSIRHWRFQRRVTQAWRDTDAADGAVEDFLWLWRRADSGKSRVKRLILVRKLCMFRECDIDILVKILSQVPTEDDPAVVALMNSMLEHTLNLGAGKGDVTT